MFYVYTMEEVNRPHISCKHLKVSVMDFSPHLSLTVCFHDQKKPHIPLSIYINPNDFEVQFVFWIGWLETFFTRIIWRTHTHTHTHEDLGVVLECSVQFSCSVVSDSLQPHELQHARPPCPSPTPRVYLNSCPLSQWCHPTHLIL